MEKIKKLISYMLISGVHLLINVIPLSMASVHISLLFSYIFFLVLNLYLFIWHNSLSFSLAKRKGLYMCFSICACVTAIISLFPIYFKYMRRETVGIYWIFLFLMFLCFIGGAYDALSTYKHYDEKKNAKVNKWGVPIRSYNNSECVSEQKSECGGLRTFIHECVGERHKKKKLAVLIFIGVWCTITIYSFVCYCYRCTHDVSYFQNLSNNHRIKAECAAKDFVSMEHGYYEAKAFAEPSKFCEYYLTESDICDTWDARVYYTTLIDGEIIDGEHKLYVELKSNSAEVYYIEDRESFWFLLFKEWPRLFSYKLLKSLEKIVFPIFDIFLKE